MSINLTAREQSILAAFDTFEYVQDDVLAVGSGTYGFSFADGIQRVLGCTRRSALGSIAALIQKGLVSSQDEDGDAWITLTQEGYEAILGLHARRELDAVQQPVVEDDAADGFVAPLPEQSGDVHVRVARSTYRWTLVEQNATHATVERTRRDGSTQQRVVELASVELI